MSVTEFLNHTIKKKLAKLSKYIYRYLCKIILTPSLRFKPSIEESVIEKEIILQDIQYK